MSGIREEKSALVNTLRHAPALKYRTGETQQENIKMEGRWRRRGGGGAGGRIECTERTNKKKKDGDASEFGGGDSGLRLRISFFLFPFEQDFK